MSLLKTPSVVICIFHLLEEGIDYFLPGTLCTLKTFDNRERVSYDLRAQLDTLIEPNNKKDSVLPRITICCSDGFQVRPYVTDGHKPSALSKTCKLWIKSYTSIQKIRTVADVFHGFHFEARKIGRDPFGGVTGQSICSFQRQNDSENVNIHFSAAKQMGSYLIFGMPLGSETT